MSEGRLLRGVGVSRGVVRGPARVVQWELPKVTRRTVSADQVPGELDRLQAAVAAVKRAMIDLSERARERVGVNEAKIFDAQIMMLEDPEFLRDVEMLIRENQLTAERAFEFRTLELKALWSQSASGRLRQRIADLSGIQLAVLSELTGRGMRASLDSPDERPGIVVTRELTPSLLVELDRTRVVGFASEEGTRISHAAILARSLKTPCVMGLVGAMEAVKPGTDVILDGTAGTLLLSPTAAELEESRSAEQLRQGLDSRIRETAALPGETLDGTRVTIQCNVDLPEDLEMARSVGADGIGLLRTEFLLLGRSSMPTEDEQTGFFERAVNSHSGKTVVVRSYDLGGDKYPLSMDAGHEANPMLGWRAIRVCVDNPELFQSQIRALLRARRHGDLRLMLPLVTRIEELETTREFVALSKRELAARGVAFAADLPVGVMIETPAAALQADQFAAHTDFLSVGTNDLTQYTLAVDRGNARLARRFTHHHPAVVQLLKRIVDAGNRAGHATAVCGEMASHPPSVFLLLGLGYRVLSVTTQSVPVIRWFVRQVDLTVAEQAATDALAADTTRDVEAILERAMGTIPETELLRAGQLPQRNGAATLNWPQ